MKERCSWAHEDKPLLADYHDTEWGIPVHEDQKHFELLSLEGQQAGLSWELILKKREAYRTLFHHFNPEKVAAMSDETLNEICLNREIIRNKRKVFSIRNNAQAFLKIQKEHQSFDAFVWPFMGGKPQVNRWNAPEDIPSVSPESASLSKALKKWGFSFVGPTIIYSYMQAAGLVSDHLKRCFR